MKLALCFVSVLCVLAQTPCVSIKHGTGAQAGDGVSFPKVGDTVTIHYVGTLSSNGQKFDSSRDRGRPFTTQIGLGKVIQGWDQGVLQLTLGERAVLTIGSSCAYGVQGFPPAIPGGSDLVFDVELLGINDKMAPGAAAAAAPAPTAPAALPTCKQSSCGMGIAQSAGAPAVCACHASCLAQGSTLPCCQSYREVCGQPSAAPASAPAPQASAPPQQSAPQPSAPQPKPALVASSPVAQPMALPPASMPECIPEQCGKAVAWPNGGRPVCLCNPMCELQKGVPGVLPCCAKLQEVCLDPWRSPSPNPPAAPAPSPQTPVAQAPVALAATLAVSPAAPAAPKTQLLGTEGKGKVAAPAKGKATPKGKAGKAGKGPDIPAICDFGKTKWQEADACEEKRYAIRNGKCDKVCDPVQPGGAVHYFPKNDEGKEACKAMLRQCELP